MSWRLIQWPTTVRLGCWEGDEERRWAKAAIRLLWAGIPIDPGEVASWPVMQRLLPHVLAAAEHAERLGVAGEATGWLLSWASGYLRQRGQPRQARPLAERALTITQAAVPSDRPELAERHDELGRLLRNFGDLAGARREFERALPIYEAAYGPDHPYVATVRNNLGGVFRDLGDLAGARREFERALAIREAAYGLDHPATEAVRSHLAGL